MLQASAKTLVEHKPKARMIPALAIFAIFERILFSVNERTPVINIYAGVLFLIEYFFLRYKGLHHLCRSGPSALISIALAAVDSWNGSSIGRLMPKGR